MNHRYPRICPVCRVPYTKNTTTCSTACRAKASRRKRAHQPIANPYSPQEIQNLLTELADLKTENQRLRAAQKRTKDWKTEATKAQAKLATAQKRLNPALENNKTLTQKKPATNPATEEKFSCDLQAHPGPRST